MSGIYLLDTNAAIALLKADLNLQKLLDESDEYFVSAITLGEMYYGAERSARIEYNRAQVDQFSADRVILLCDTDTARWYGKVKQQLRAKGRPIPDNDIWIAAIALQYDLTLMTRDEHFKQVDGLSLETW